MVFSSRRNALGALSGALTGSKIVLPSRWEAHFHLLGHLKAILGHLGAILGHRGVILGYLATILGHLRVI